MNTKTVQVYNIHLLNGDVIPATDDYETPKGKKSFMEKIAATTDDTWVTIGDCISGYCYFPKKNIVYISQGDVLDVLDMEKIDKKMRGK